MARRGAEPGDIVEIVSPGGGAAYGQVLRDPYVAVYAVDRLDDGDVTLLDGAPVRFVVAVEHAPTRSGRWRVLGRLPDSRVPVPIPEYFTQSWVDADDCQIVDADGTMRPAAAADCEGLEPAIVWSAERLEQRIADERAGVPNQQLTTLALRRP